MRKLNPKLVHRTMSAQTKAAALLSALALAFGAHGAVAQSDIQWDRPAAAYDPYGSSYVAAAFSPREVESLVAPIALFPDNLVAQILMAATYPYDIEDAAGWVSDSRNARLVGYALADALDGMDWDPSVKALTSAPDVLRMMDERRDWTQRLGQAFMADQGMVMDAVQHLRHQARAAGRLYPDRYRRIIDRDGEITIEPVSASEMYVQFYDPAIAFGAWAYPDYPPYYFPRVYYDIVRPIPIVTPLWGWSSWDWRGRHLRLDVGRWQRLNHNRPHQFTGNTWRHDPGRNRNRQFRGPDRTNFTPGGRPGFGGRDGNRWDGDRRDGRPNQPQARPQANGNPAFHGRGPGLNQDNNQRWNGGRNGRDRTDRGRQEASVNPVAPSATPPVVTPDNRERGRQFNGFNRPDGNGGRNADRDGWRQRRQEANVNPAPQATPVPQAQPQPTQPDRNRFGRGGDGGRGEGRGWQRREQANVNPVPQPQAQPNFRQRGEGQANAGGEFRGRGRGGPPPQAAPQPQQQPQAQPQNNDNNNGQQRRFHGRGRGDDPAR